MKFFPWVFLFVAAFAAFAASSFSQTIKWTAPLPGPPSAPTLFPNEIAPTGVVITAGSNIIRLKGDGAVTWQVDAGAFLATPASIADIDADGVTEIVAALADGTVVCLDENGKSKWTRACNAQPGGFKSIALADVMPNPGLESLAAFDDGWMYCLDCKGNVLWRFFGDKYRGGGGIAVADLDGDGAPEIVYGTDNGHVYCLDGAGRVKWRYSEMAPYGRSGPNVADLMVSGHPELLITRSNVGNATCLMALDAATGRFKWRTQDMMQGYCSNATADLDGDGTFEVLHGDKGNNLYCENCDGSRRWKTELNGRGIFWAPCVADGDGDGRPECIVGVRDVDPDTGNNVYVLDANGAVKAALKCGGSANATPVAGDIDGDGNIELIAMSSSPNQAVAYTWNAKGRVCWPSLRGNSRMTANGNVPMGVPKIAAPVEPAGEVRVAVSATYWGDNQWAMGWTKPAPENACIEVAVSAPDGSAEIRIIDLKKGATAVYIHFRIAHAATSRVTMRMLAPNEQAPLFVRVHSVKPQDPAAYDFRGVKEICADPTNAGMIEPFAKRVTLLQGDEQAMKTAVQHEPETVPDRATALRKHAAALMQQATMLDAYWKSGGTGNFVFWQEQNPWGNFDPEKVPASVDLKAPIQVTAYGNESEDVALTLFNIGDEAIDVRCTFSEPNMKGQRAEPEPELAKHVTLRRCVPVASALGDRINDALPELDLSRTITLPPFEGRQLWLVINTAGLQPGTHELKLHMGSLSKPPTFYTVPIQIEVWPVELPGTVYRKINWSSFNKGEMSDEAIKDMIDHCVNVIYGPPLPHIPVDALGNRNGEVDWKAFDEILAKAPKHFFFLWGGPAPCKWPEGVAPKEDSPEFFTGFQTGIREMAAHLIEKGFPYDQWAFYPFDEPWNTGFTLVPQLKKFCERVKKADPNAQNYADPAGLVRIEYLDEFKGLIDVWQPEINLLKRDPKLVEWFKTNARHFWAYEAPGPAKDLLPLDHYRANPWIAWKFGLEGTGYWVYRIDDIWFTAGECDYSVVYAMNDNTVPSRRWEANRDGVEDYRALYVLKQEAEKARAAGRTADADHAQALMDKAVDDLVGWQIKNIDEITRMTRDYELDYELLMKYRNEIAQETIKLRNVK